MISVQRCLNLICRKVLQFPEKLLGVINIFEKVAGYTTNTQKLVAFLYTNNEESKK